MIHIIQFINPSWPKQLENTCHTNNDILRNIMLLMINQQEYPSHLENNHYNLVIHHKITITSIFNSNFVKITITLMYVHFSFYWGTISKCYALKIMYKCTTNLKCTIIQGSKLFVCHVSVTTLVLGL